jgi:hypothetical protein
VKPSAPKHRGQKCKIMQNCAKARFLISSRVP